MYGSGGGSGKVEFDGGVSVSLKSLTLNCHYKKHISATLLPRPTITFRLTFSFLTILPPFNFLIHFLPL